MSNVVRPPIYKSIQGYFFQLAGVLTVNVFYNSIGSVTVAKIAAGHWSISSAINLFTVAKTMFIPAGSPDGILGEIVAPIYDIGIGGHVGVMRMIRVNAKQVDVELRDSTNTLNDLVSCQSYFEIRVFP